MKTKQDNQCINKKYVTMFMTTPECPLSYSDLLVYCYLVFQSTYGDVPSKRKAAKATGLKEDTVAKAVARLQEHGLLAANNSVVSPCPRMDWFQQLEPLREQHPDGHWCKWLRNWRAYIRKPGADNRLKVTDVLIYSLLRNSLVNGWKPQHGWTSKYIALATGTSDETVSRAIQRLQELGFLEMDDGMRFRLFKLQPSQLGCFADKKKFSGTSSSEPDAFIDEFSPASEAMERDAAEKKDLRNWLEPMPITDKWKNRIYSECIKHVTWPDYRPLGEKLLSKALVHPDY